MSASFEFIKTVKRQKYLFIFFLSFWDFKSHNPGWPRLALNSGHPCWHTLTSLTTKDIANSGSSLCIPQADCGNGAADWTDLSTSSDMESNNESNKCRVVISQGNGKNIYPECFGAMRDEWTFSLAGFTPTVTQNKGKAVFLLLPLFLALQTQRSDVHSALSPSVEALTGYVHVAPFTTSCLQLYYILLTFPFYFLTLLTSTHTKAHFYKMTSSII